MVRDVNIVLLESCLESQLVQPLPVDVVRLPISEVLESTTTLGQDLVELGMMPEVLRHSHDDVEDAHIEVVNRKVHIEHLLLPVVVFEPFGQQFDLVIVGDNLATSLRKALLEVGEAQISIILIPALLVILPICFGPFRIKEGPRRWLTVDGHTSIVQAPLLFRAVHGTRWNVWRS